MSGKGDPVKRQIDGFVLVGLGICLLMALFLSPFASSNPDGLEKVAETKGFASKGEGWKFWKHAPLPDYEIPWIKNKNLSTAISGLVGTLAIFLLALGIGRLIKNSSVKKILVLIWVVWIIPFFSSAVFAARPLTTDDAYTVEKGKFQVETGFDFARQDNHNKEFFPSVTLTYGLLERMDIGLGSSYQFADPNHGEKESGLGDTALKVKYRLVDQKDWIPSFAISGTVKIPTASESKGLGSGKVDYNLNSIFTWNLSRRLQLYVNGGYTFIGEHGARNELNYSFAGQFVLSDKWALVGEIVGVNNFNGHKSDDPFSGLFGTQCLITDSLVWDVGMEIGMNRAAPDFRLTTGLTIFYKP
jgi:cobalt/nickel transport protein